MRRGRDVRGFSSGTSAPGRASASNPAASLGRDGASNPAASASSRGGAQNLTAPGRASAPNPVAPDRAVASRSGRTGAKLLLALGLALMLAAACLTAFNLREAQSARSASSQVVEQLAAAVEETALSSSTAFGTAKSARPLSTDVMSTMAIDGREYVGFLRVPELGLELPVLAEWSYSGLRVAPCRYAGSVYAGDMVVAAHNYASHFGSLRGLSYGDEVSFVDVLGNVFTYRVASVEQLDPYAVEDMTESEYPLTLFTCTLGGANRVTVRCEEVSWQAA